MEHWSFNNQTNYVADPALSEQQRIIFALKQALATHAWDKPDAIKLTPKVTPAKSDLQPVKEQKFTIRSAWNAVTNMAKNAAQSFYNRIIKPAGILLFGRREVGNGFAQTAVRVTSNQANTASYATATAATAQPNAAAETTTIMFSSKSCGCNAARNAAAASSMTMQSRFANNVDGTSTVNMSSTMALYASPKPMH